MVIKTACSQPGSAVWYHATMMNGIRSYQQKKNGNGCMGLRAVIALVSSRIPHEYYAFMNKYFWGCWQLLHSRIGRSWDNLQVLSLMHVQCIVQKQAKDHSFPICLYSWETTLSPSHTIFRHSHLLRNGHQHPGKFVCVLFGITNTCHYTNHFTHVPAHQKFLLNGQLASSKRLKYIPWMSITIRQNKL